MGFVLLLSGGGLIASIAHRHRHDALAEIVALSLATGIVAWLLQRIMRSGTLVASQQGVMVRALLRTHRWHWPELASFEEVDRVIGANPAPRRVLRVHLTGGGSRDLTGLNDSRQQNPDTIADLVLRLTALKESAPDTAT
jgi:hypothetical protein